MNPCVRLGLSQSSVEVTDKDVNGRREGGIRRRRSGLVPSTLQTAPSVPSFLASVMELESLLVRHGVPRARGEAPPAAMPFPFTVIGGLKLDDEALTSGTNVKSPEIEDDDVDHSHLIAAAMVTSFYSAIGTLNVPPSVATNRPLAYRANRVDRGFVHEVKLRLEALTSQPTFNLRLGSSVKRRVFMGRFDDLSPDDADFNGRRAIAGLVSAGLAPDARQAAQFLLDHLLGERRSDMSFPRATVETAAAFVKLLVETGVLGQTMGPNQLDCEVSFETLMPRAMYTVETFPGYQVPFREVWLQAMEVVSVETRMQAVIDAVSAVPDADATVKQITELVDGAAPRRRRVAV